MRGGIFAIGRTWEKLKEKSGKLKQNVFVLYLACRHSGTPRYAKWFAAFVVAYAFSPIDLIPDFIPVLGYLDDLILIPVGIWLALRWIPPSIILECRLKAEELGKQGKLKNRIAGAVIVFIWLGLAVWLGFIFAGI
jgi:uncharacterized membrane protein YkvA (DUF1232 family)